MEPLRDPNPSDVLEVRPAPCPFLGGLKSQKGPPRAAPGGRVWSRGRPGGARRSPPLTSRCVPKQNLDDSVFSKRHAKLELDEKRRKR